MDQGENLQPAMEAEERLLRNIFRNLPFDDKLTFRQVSRQFNEIFRFSGTIKNCVLVVDGKVHKDMKETATTLVRTTVKWSNLKFTNFDMQDLLDDELCCYNFGQKWKPIVKSLTLARCHILLGRFMELLSFLENLTELVLINVPGLYNEENPVNLLNWKEYIELFDQRIKALKTLSLYEEKSGALDEESTLFYLLDKTGSLESLTVHTGIDEDSPYPKVAILRAMKLCSSSLRHLDLSGNSISCITKKKKYKSLWGGLCARKVNITKLEVLKLAHIPVEHHFGLVLDRLTNLMTLKIISSALPSRIFKDAGQALPFLQVLQIENCYVEADVLGIGFAGCNFLTSVTFKNNANSDTGVDEYIKFFQYGSQNLQNVVVEGNTQPSIMKNLLEQIITPSNGDHVRDELKTLEVSYFEGFTQCNKNCLAYVANSLTSLSFSHTDVDDSWGVVISEMKELTCLFLDQTKVGMDFAERIVFLPKLKCLDLDDTMYTVDEYEKFFVSNGSEVDLFHVFQNLEEDEEEDEGESEESEEDDNMHD